MSNARGKDMDHETLVGVIDPKSLEEDTEDVELTEYKNAQFYMDYKNASTEEERNAAVYRLAASEAAARRREKRRRAALDRPVAMVYRHGLWRVAEGRKDVSQHERFGIEHPSGNGDTPSAHRLLPANEHEGNIEWAENVMASASEIPVIATLIFGFAITNLFETDLENFKTDHSKWIYLCCLALTVIMNLYIAIVLTFYIIIGTRWLANDKRCLVSGRYIQDNAVYIADDGSHVSPAHGHVANKAWLIGRCRKLLFMSIACYVVAILVFAFDHYPQGPAIFIIVAFVFGFLMLLWDTCRMGAFRVG